MRTLSFSERQISVLAQVASGKKLEDIAKAEFVAFRTVARDLEDMREKLDAENLTHLCMRAFERGVIVPDGSGRYRAPSEKQPPRRTVAQVD